MQPNYVNNLHELRRKFIINCVNPKGIALPIILIIFVLTLFLGSFGYIYYKNIKVIDVELGQLNLDSEDYLLNVSQTDYLKLSGKTELLNQKLDIIMPYDEQDAINTANTKFYSAGVYDSGKYAGFTRIIILRPSANSMQGYEQSIVATKDFKEYVVNGNPKLVDHKKDYEELGYEDPRHGFNLEKVTKADFLPNSSPEELYLDDKFGLHKDQYDQLAIDTEKTILISDLSKFKQLTSPNKDFKLYAKKPNDDEIPKTMTNYIVDETTAIYLVDSTGLVFNYSLANVQNNKNYISKLKEYNRLDKEYEKKQQEINARIKKHEEETGEQGMVIDDYPTSPDRPNTPSLNFESRDLTDIVESPFNSYEKYEHAFPRVCAHDPNTFTVKNIGENDLKQVGKISGIDVFTFRDQNHPLQKIAYQRKVDNYNELIKDLYKGDSADSYLDYKPPAYDVYAKSTPLVFMKDYWGRWAVLEEPNYNVSGGCGKPVVYLYPTEPTEISLKFTAPMKLETQIPLYTNGWKVKAYPDGKIIDLNPHMTNCANVSTAYGSEYAHEACVKNEYPYIYWSGESHVKNYPQIDKGWIVSSGEVAGLLIEKLTEIGLNQTEQNDMLEYWLPQIEAKNAPYYRISLLQNDELNKLFPMQVTPRPESVIRVFLDFLPLNSANELSMPEQKVIHFDRKGFTLVEWGGLKR